MKLSELSYRVTRNIFLNRDTGYAHMGNDVSMFLGEFFFVQNLSTYTSLEPEFNADRSFLWNHGLKMSRCRDIGGQNLYGEVIIFWLNFFFFQNLSTYTSLEPQFNADQSFLWNHGLKMYCYRDMGGRGWKPM